MKTTFLSVPFFLFIIGCATQELVWYHPTKTAMQAALDREQCVANVEYKILLPRMRTNSMPPPQGQTPSERPGTASRQVSQEEEQIADFMRARGYELVPRSKVVKERGSLFALAFSDCKPKSKSAYMNADDRPHRVYRAYNPCASQEASYLYTKGNRAFYADKWAQLYSGMSEEGAENILGKATSYCKTDRISDSIGGAPSVAKYEDWYYYFNYTNGVGCLMFERSSWAGKWGLKHWKLVPKVRSTTEKE